MILYADFETSTQLVGDKVNVYLWGLVSEDDSIRDYGIDLDSFFHRISLLQEEPIIYFHNISWDGSFIIHYLIDKGYKFYEKVNRDSQSNSFTWIADYNTNIYKIVVKTKYGIITFVDSIKLLLSSVSRLGDALKLPKLEIDYHNYTKFNSKNEVPQNLIDYLFRDIDIVKTFMKEMYNKVDKVKLTIAGTMYNEFQKFYGSNNFIRDFGSPNSKKSPLTRELWEKIKLSYNGGFTAISPRYVECDIQNIKGHSYDWNSMYPSIMKDYKMPYGTPTKFKVRDDDLELYEIRIFKAIKTDNFIPAMLPNGSQGVFSGKYLEECSDMTIFIWKEEWYEIIKGYEIDYLIVDRLYFRTKFVFKEFIENIMEEKVNATNSCDRFIAKIKQNSLYGKFGENLERVSKVLKFNPDNTIKGKRYGEKQQWVEFKVSSETKSISYIPIASYITSMARTLLFRAIHKNRDRFIYCDTDSLYLTDEGVGLELDDKKYGFLKLEHRFNRFKALKPKCYMLYDTDLSKIVVKVAGLPEQAQQTLTFETFYRGYELKDTKLQKVHHIGGLILENISYTL